HARWRVRFFRHLVDEHPAHPFYRDEQWFREDADYASHLAEAEEALSDMEASYRYSSAPARPCLEQQYY
ncbi:MAG: hypothetical protein ACAH88_19225, partial [Roseimicrobium sp.]